MERNILYFTQVGDHFSEYMHTSVSNDLVLCDESLEEEFKEASNEPRRGSIVVIVIVVVTVLLLYFLC